MNIKDLIIEAGYQPQGKAGTHSKEFYSPCPFCKDGENRFLIWPDQQNRDGEYKGGRFWCRVCDKSGDAITFLRLFYGMSYRHACTQLQIEPKQQNTPSSYFTVSQPKIVSNPPETWMAKAREFVERVHQQLLDHPKGKNMILSRGFSEDSISRFKFGYNPEILLKERPTWGLPSEIRPNGTERRIWLPMGIVIPTYFENQVIRIKIRRSDWKEGDKIGKYIEVPGSKQTPSIFGNTSLSCAIVLESEIDALLIQQEASDLTYCIALSGATKPLDAETESVLKKTPRILFVPDFDLSGAAAWAKWKKKFHNILCILTPSEKSVGDYFQKGGDLRKWLQEAIQSVNNK